MTTLFDQKSTVAAANRYDIAMAFVRTYELGIEARTELLELMTLTYKDAMADATRMTSRLFEKVGM